MKYHHKQRVANRMKFLIPVCLCLLFSACPAPLFLFGAGATGGILGYKYYDGKSVVVFKAPYMETWEKTTVVVEEMGLEVLKSNHNNTQGSIEAKRADGKLVFISIKYKSINETEVIIAVTPVADKAASDAIAKRIKDALFDT